MRLSTLAVSPIYWRRGHATSLVSFCTQLADLDEALLVSAHVLDTRKRQLMAV
jgi:N-acetylglutamate synthase-like GNAT family acetyltransferase